MLKPLRFRRGMNWIDLVGRNGRHGRGASKAQHRLGDPQRCRLDLWRGPRVAMGRFVENCHEFLSVLDIHMGLCAGLFCFFIGVFKILSEIRAKCLRNQNIYVFSMECFC